MGDTIKIAMEDVKKGMAAGGTLGRSLARKMGHRAVLWSRAASEGARRRFERCTPAGKALSGVGALGMLVFGYLILFDASDLQLIKKESLVVKVQTANMRKQATTQSPIKTQLHQGTALVPVEREGKWWKARIDGNENVGWIHESVVRQKDSKQLVWSYHLRFYELYFLLAAVALFVGLRMRSQPH